MSRSVNRSVKHGDARQRGDDSHEDERDQHDIEPSEHGTKYSLCECVSYNPNFYTFPYEGVKNDPGDVVK